MSNETAITTSDPATILERVVVQGDLAKLSPVERVDYYRRVCESLGLNPLTRPFQYIVLNGRLTLYASRDCTDQLRRIHRITVTIVSRERLDDIYVVTARATTPDGRSDESIGAVSIGGLRGDSLANALMKCETKAKRRATLSLVGLGWLDETETDTVPGANPVAVTDTGEIIGQAPDARVPIAEPARASAPAPARAAYQGQKATREQLNEIARLGGEAGIAREELRRICSELFGHEPERLTSAEAAQWISVLRGELELRQQAAAAKGDAA